MLLRNRTPFLAFTFESLDLDGEPFHVIIVKGTFDIVIGAGLQTAAQQEPVKTSDEHWGDTTSSSLRWEDDLAPFKPHADIIVNATAHAPGGRPAREWLAGITVGDLTKRVRVTGPRAWAHAPLLGWGLGDPVPTAAVPIRYENAFGGKVEQDGANQVYEENPVGVGFVDLRKLDTSRTVPAPTILPPDGHIPALGKPCLVEGLSSIAKAWQPRRARAGTFDAAWIAERHPRLPSDFDPAYYNCAHPDLIYDGHLRGDEMVRLERLHPEHEIITFRLPSLTVAAAIIDRDGHRYGGSTRLDTLYVDADRMKALLTWRLTLPLYTRGIKQLDVGVRESLSKTLERATGNVISQEGS